MPTPRSIAAIASRPLRRLVAAVLALAALGLPSATSAAQLRATPATLDSVFASAAGGDTIELAGGDYGTFSGSQKSGMVTLTPASGAAVSMALDFDPASNITIDGVTITEAVLADGATHDIVVRNSDFPGQVTFRTNELANASILFERNVHHDFDKCGDCGEGRVFLPGATSQPSGITIRNSEFRGGLSDGIQNGSNGTKILGNSFHDIEPGSSEGVHADAIQLYGSHNTVIRGNYFYDLIDVPAIMSPDGADHEIIEDNVFEGGSGSYPYALTLFSDDGSIIRHNTFADGDCDFNLHCGILRIGAKSGDPEGRGTVVEDNIVSQISVEAGSLARRTHNLVAHDQPSGSAEIAGSPTYVGGSSPTSYAAYRLASGSLGAGNASDGLDRGARIDGSAPPPGAPPVADPPGAETEVVAPAGPGDPPVADGISRCAAAKAKVKRAKMRLRKAAGHEQVQRARKRLRRARLDKRSECRGPGSDRLSDAAARRAGELRR